MYYGAKRNLLNLEIGQMKYLPLRHEHREQNLENGHFYGFERIKFFQSRNARIFCAFLNYMYTEAFGMSMIFDFQMKFLISDHCDIRPHRFRKKR